jgi:hypothetical protein
MGKVLTEISFDYIGGDKNVPKMYVSSDRLEIIWEAVENELAARRFVRHNLSYSWLVNRNGLCIARLLSTNGIISQFRIRNGTDKRYEE